MYPQLSTRLSSQLLQLGYLVEHLKSAFRKFYGQYLDLIQQYEVSWHADPWPVKATSPPIRLSTNIMSLIPSLTFTELRVVFMEHLQQTWHASRERLPFWTPGSVPLFETCFSSYCWDQISQTCRVFSQLFGLNTPRYFLDFVSNRLCHRTVLTVDIYR